VSYVENILEKAREKSVYIILFYLLLDVIATRPYRITGIQKW